VSATRSCALRDSSPASQLGSRRSRRGGSYSARINRVAGALKISQRDAAARVEELGAAQLLDAPAGEGLPVNLTDTGQHLIARIRGAVTEITQRLWGDLPPEDLATAGRVLSTILERANAELAGR
jgi:DNA-binding MarR family transcriptional regulator